MNESLPPRNSTRYDVNSANTLVLSSLWKIQRDTQAHLALQQAPKFKPKGKTRATSASRPNINYFNGQADQN